MGELIENRPVMCNLCGYSPVPGREQCYEDNRNRQIVHECRWVCPRCGRLTRHDEKYEKMPEAKSNE